MARIEKTVFISYRRTDVYTALAVYENLKNQGYDVFFDYRSISSGDFEQIITSNIRARAHLLLILTCTALDRCYSACVGTSICKEPVNKNSRKQTDYFKIVAYNNFPVLFVDWEMAHTYCAWAGRRLPTEAQWEKAARGTDGRVYPWGNDPPNGEFLNFNWIVGDVSAVRSYTAGTSPYGAYDMAGNVWEWVNDWYSESYYMDFPPSNP